MSKRALNPEAANAVESVFRSSHGREMTAEERRYFKMPDAHNGNSSHDSGKAALQSSPVQAQPMAVIAWLTHNPDKLLLHKLNGCNYRVMEANTSDKLVVLCLGQHVEVVIVDQSFFFETAGWNIARSVKHIKPHAYVIIVSRQNWPHDRLPKGVDAIVPSAEPQLLLGLLEQLHPA